MQRTKDVGILTILFVLYVATGLAGLRLALVQPNATAVWPPAGIALAAMLLVGYRVWPAILAGAFVLNLLTNGTIVTSLAIGAGNTAEALASVYLIRALAGGRETFSRATRVFFFAFIATLVPTISATCGMMILSLSGLSAWTSFQLAWTTWWLGDATSDLIVTPVILLWAVAPHVRWHPRRAFEGALLLAALFLVGLVSFGGLFPFAGGREPLAFLCTPLLVWIAFRFDQKKVSAAMIVLAGIAVWGTLQGYGQFAVDLHESSLVMLQVFLATLAVMSLVVAAVVGERREADLQMQALTVCDPLTGLGNYRRLFEGLSVEIARSARSGRPFAVLFVDVDGLKQINDRYGHLAGNDALCRVAQVLRRSCRKVDVVARFGGDEFAIVLPETGKEGAYRAATRIADHLGEDIARPSVTVSMGAAVYPADGETPDMLLSSADRVLYDMKGHALSRQGGRAI